MRRSVFLGLALFTALAAMPRLASANECNLYEPEQFGQIRVGCSLTVFAFHQVDPRLPRITRGDQIVVPSVEQDQIVLKVAFYHYPSPDSCDLPFEPQYENQTFDRYVMSWPELQAGDEIEVDGYPMVVPGPGECGTVEPFFACADPIQPCSDAANGSDDSGDDDIDQGGCAAGGGSLGWLAVLGLVGLAWSRRRSR